MLRWKGLSELLRPSRNHLASESGNVTESRYQAMSLRCMDMLVGNSILDTADTTVG
jgi:hypothetical protein